MIEGDGSISKSSNEISLVGSREIVNGFAKFCTSVCPNIVPRFRVNGKLSVVSVCSKLYSKEVLDELYRDCKLKLSRKYNTYLEKYYGIN